MKIFVNISRALLVGCFLVFMSTEALAQKVKLRVVPMSPGKLSAIGKSDFIYMVICFYAPRLHGSS